MRPGNALTLAAFAGSTYVLASFANAQCGAPWSFIPGTGPSARYGHAMVFESATHHTILFGGYGLADTWHYTGATQTWSQLPIAGPSWRYGHALTFDAAQGTILLFGGMHGNTPLAETWSFDPLLATWTMLSPAAAPAPRLYPAMAYDSARARTVLFGGGAPDGPFYNDTWEFDGRRIPGSGTVWAKRPR